MKRRMRVAHVVALVAASACALTAADVVVDSAAAKMVRSPPSAVGFRIEETSIDAFDIQTEPEAIPALSRWGVVLLVSLLSVLGIRALHLHRC